MTITNKRHLKIPKIDLTIMHKKFVNKLNPVIIGIEVKHDFLNKSDIIKNLKRYAKSGDVTKLYLACYESKNAMQKRYCILQNLKILG